MNISASLMTEPASPPEPIVSPVEAVLPTATGRRSFRRILRAFQTVRGSPPDAAFLADLEFLENRDLDLSIRIGALIAFNALMITIGTHPISASPGAPLSLDAAAQPYDVIASIIGILPFVVSSFLCLRALLIGEEFDYNGLDEARDALRQRLLAAFIRSVDAQSHYLTHAVRWAIAGGVLTITAWAFIMGAKMVGG